MDSYTKGCVIFVILLLSGCASNDEWTRDDTAWEVIYATTALTDAWMSTKIKDHPNIIENGPIARPLLGLNPEPAEMYVYMGTVIVSHYLISRMLPEGWRRFWQVGGTIRHGLAINHGHQIGLFSEPCTVHPCEVE